MTADQFWLIALLAVSTYLMRLAGLFMGQKILASPRLAPFLQQLPACLVVALVAASLSDADAATWLAALAALSIAIWTNSVVITMIGGMAAVLGLNALLGLI